MIDAVDHRSTTGYNLRSTDKKRKPDQTVVSQSSSPIRKRNGRFPSTRLQFFVRDFPDGKTIVIRADSTDLVEIIHKKIMLITGIPEDEQRIIYRGKQLRPEHTLASCGVQNDATMYLVGRMRSTDNPQACQLISDLISMITGISKRNYRCFPSDSDRIIMLLTQFTTMTPLDSVEKACAHMELFVSSSAPAALVMLFMSSDIAKIFIADESIRTLVNSFKTMLPSPLYNVCAPIVSEFCKLLRGLDHRLYDFCRSSLGAVEGFIGMLNDQTLLPSQTRIQFFVRLFPGGKTLVIQGYSTDTVELIYYRIMSITGIPTAEQRLIYMGKQLQSEQTLADCGIQKDETVQLVGRMRSTGHPQAWMLIDELVSLVFDILKTNYATALLDAHHVTRLLTDFLTRTPKNIEKASQHLQIFISSSAPAALVMLYMSPDKNIKFTAHYSIRTFINLLKSGLPKHTYNVCAQLVLKFCKLLRGAAGLDDQLYIFCRSRIGAIVEAIGIARCKVTKEELSALNDVFLFVREVVVPELSHDLELSMGSMESMGLSLNTVRDFTEYMCLVRELLQPPFGSPISLPLKKHGISETYREYVECLHRILSDLHLILYDLLHKMELCLRKLEDQLRVREKGKGKPIVSRWSQYLVMLKELSIISKLLNSLEVFWQKMRQRKVSLCFLIVTYAKRSDDCLWVIEHKEVTNFEVRRHLAMMMLQEVRNENQEPHEMLIDRSQLLEESFEYIRHANPVLLRGNLFMGFKHEEATGPGVLREWFFLVCRAIFNPQNALFVACPNDRRRFLPNPASKVDPLHLEYFCFSGRMIALALMHKIQIGIVFDRVFFLQLAGEVITLEDIRDADPYLYSSCKQILDMDPETVDQDILSLTFVCDVEELGSRKMVELCPNGKDIIVNSKNRKEYVNLLIQHKLVTSIAQQIAHFSRGFADISTLRIQTSLFRSLDPEDLDQILDGSGSAISIDDWKAHTDYHGYKESDRQISWFWKIVGLMSAEQRKILLFFWTSIKYLPLEGFGGLASRLHIYKTSESCDHLPHAQTCFYRIRFPPYKSMGMMRDRLRVITQEHVGCSFGTL